MFSNVLQNKKIIFQGCALRTSPFQNKSIMNTSVKKNLKYIINPAYTIVPDKKCTFITNSKKFDTFNKNIDVDSGFYQSLPPLYAYIFSYFTGKHTFEETINDISEKTGIDKLLLTEFVKPFINNSEKILIQLHEIHSSKIQNQNWIPINFIIESSNIVRDDIHEASDFLIPKQNWNLSEYRTAFPHRLTLMLTNKCRTECIYCYADKTHNIETLLSTEKYIEIIREADALGVLSIDVNGGEVFLHPGFEQILEELYKHGYNPYLSTKIPLEEKEIVKFKQIGMKNLQLSIDVWDGEIMKKLLGVNSNYFFKIQKSLENLEKHGINVKIKSVITKYNDSPEQIIHLLNNLTKFENILDISIAAAEYSLYKGPETFKNYRTSQAKWTILQNTIEDYISTHKTKCEISCQNIDNEKEYCNSVEVKRKNFINRSKCTANINSLYVLPDGKVGICEELYWNKNFILGDLNKQNIMEIWNSEKATKLYKLSQSNFRMESACSICTDFDYCRLNSGVCWKLIIAAYGEDHCDLPDPRCHYAPPITNLIYIS